MKFFFSSEAGVGLIQSMVAGALILGGGIFIMNTQEVHQKARKSIELSTHRTVLMDNLAQLMSVHDVCGSTLSKDGPITASEKPIGGIYDIGGNLLLGPDYEVEGKKIVSFHLSNYSPAAGIRQTGATLDVKFREIVPAAKKTSFSGSDHKFSLPLTMLTSDNVVVKCSTDFGDNLLDAFKAACEGLGGVFNSLSGHCDDLHGANGPLLEYVELNLCASSPSGCKHPYAGKDCKGVDFQGIARENFAIKGFNPDGTFNCACVPQACPNPSLFCVGQDLGTDKCSVVCPPGNNAAIPCP